MNSEDRRANAGQSPGREAREATREARRAEREKTRAFLNKLKDTPRGRAYLEKLEKENLARLDREFPIEPMEHPSKVKL